MPENRRISPFLASLLFVQLMIGLNAQTFAATRWYQVEMIVFKQNHSVTTIKEPIPENTILPDPSTAIPLNYQGDSTKLFGSSVAFKLLGRNMLTMKNYYNKLASSSAYQPVAHIAWRQPVPYSRNGYKLQLKLGRVISKSSSDSADFPTDKEIDKEDDESPMISDSSEIETTTPAPSPIRTSVNTQLNEFTGTLKISRGQYLHFNIDLAYHHKGARPEDNKIYRMQEIRRMRSKKVHLLDHPMFAVIVYFTPLKGSKDTK